MSRPSQSGKSRYLAGIAITAFSVLGGGAQLLSMGLYWTLLTVLGTLGCVAVGLIISYQARRGADHAHRLLRKLLRPLRSTSFTVRPVTTEEQLLLVNRIDDEHYQDENIPHATLVAWWKAYPRGLWILYERGNCVGALGLWPIKKGPFAELLKGTRIESEISGSAIERCPKKPRWYVGGIVLAKHVRRPKALQQLIQTSLIDWISSEDLTAAVDVVAIAYTDEGRAMLDDLGFSIATSSDKSRHRHPVYFRNAVKVEEIKALAKALEPSPTPS